MHHIVDVVYHQSSYCPQLASRDNEDTMGWMQALRESTTSVKNRDLQAPRHVTRKSGIEAPEISHIEDISITTEPAFTVLQSLPIAPHDVSDAELPFVLATEFQAQALASHVDDHELHGRLCLVIDNIVYDCTQFADEHPGGRQVLESFRGQDCSWQFWRFHSKDVMARWGRSLRVARTEGVKNRWKERPRFVGLRKLGDDDW